jgi:WD40 repeat protein
MADSDPDSITNINRSGGADLNAGRDLTIGGDVVGRDKITTVFTGDQQYDVHGLANPYLGLQSFTYTDHAKYAGREKPIVETVARLTAPNYPLALLFITGASGSGKSSFVQAGVLPALEKHYAALSVKWAVFRPSRDPLAALSDAIWRQLGLPQFDPNTASSADFGDFLQTHTLPQQVNVIVIDQFEELFTQSNAQPRDALFTLLTQLPPFRVTRTHIIATVRADYLPELFTLPTLYDIAKHGIDLRAMSVDELREAIQQPLRAAYPDNTKRFQPELVERLAQDAAEDAAYLPLLQVTLEEIWRKGTLTLGAYTNLADAIKQRADKVLAYQDYDVAQPDQPRSPEEQAAILTLCLDLVDVSLDDEARRDVRRRRAKDELVSGAPERAELIDTLAQARLLSADKEPGEPPCVEVDLIHETLLSNWDRLRQAIAERRHELQQRARFEQQLKDWIGQNRSDDYLLSGVRLAEARELERRDDVAMRNADAKDIVHRSVEREEARRQKELDDARKLAESQRLRAEEQTRSAARLRQRAMYLVAALGVALLLGIAASVFGVQSNQNAAEARRNAATAQAASTLAVANASTAEAESNRAKQQEQIAIAARSTAEAEQSLSRSRELAAVALSQIDQDTERGLLIAIEAGKAADTYQAQDVLRQLLLDSRLRAVLRGHGATITTVQFSPNGQRVITAGCDQIDKGSYCTSSTARMWDAALGSELAVLRGHEGTVNSAAFSPDGQRVVTASDDRTARIWDAATGKELAVLHGHENWVINAQFSPDGQRVVTASDDGTARIWDAATGKELVVLRGQLISVYEAAFSPDEKWVVTASADGTARVWEAATGTEVAVLRGHGDRVTHAAFFPYGPFWPYRQWVVTASVDGTARVWEAATGKELVVLRGHIGEVTSAVFDPFGQRIVTAGGDGTARVWDPATGTELALLRGHESWLRSAAFDPSGQRVVTASDDGTVRIWDAVTGEELAVLRGHVGAVTRAVYSSDGQWVVSAGVDQTARIWDATAEHELAVVRGHEDGVHNATYSADVQRVITVDKDGIARLWDVATSQELAVLRGHEGKVSSVAFSLDGQKVVTASDDKTARIWDASTGKELAVLRGHEGKVSSVAFSLDGQKVVTASDDKTARIWDASTGKELAVLRGHEGKVSSVAFSPDGQKVVTASDDKTARIWDASTGKELAVLRGPENWLYSAAFSPDGQRIVTAGCNQTNFTGDCTVGTARVWDAVTGKELAVLRGHEGGFNGAAFSPDGQRVVTTSDDKTARVWNPATGQELAVLRGHADGVNSAVFSLDGQRIVTSDKDGRARIYLVHIEDLIALAKTRVTRELTCEERVQYLHEDVVCPTPTPATTPAP